MYAKTIYLTDGLDGLMGGAVTELVDDAIRLIAENIADPNTDAKKTRSVTIKLTFKPDKERFGVSLDADVKPALAPRNGISTLMTLRRDGGGALILSEQSRDVLPGQLDMEGNEAGQKIAPIVPLKSGGKN